MSILKTPLRHRADPPLLSAAQMRAVEQAAIDSGAATGLALMERAGHGVVASVFDAWPELAAGPHRAVVLCGPGNNGGDGFVVARLLQGWGWEVAVFLYGEADKLPPDARVNHARWGGEVSVLSRETWEDVATRSCDLLVDALFGTGLRRAVDLPLATLAPAAAGGRCRIVAVDIPSGLCGDSGRGLGEAGNRVTADLTVSFHTEKIGHRLQDGPAACGRTVVADIGLGRGTAALPGEVVRLVAGAAAGAAGKQVGQHKYDHGHAVILCGEMGRSGAGRLAARGALRVGAGLVTVAAPGSAMMECAAQLTAIMLRRADDAGALAGLLQDGRLNAVCLGPGLGAGQGTRDLVAAALAQADGSRGVVLDADALTAFTDDPRGLFDMVHPRTVLTPHGGEFARLFPDIAERLAAPATAGPAFSKRDATREAAARAGCVVLLKGADTVIADPSGACAVNSAAYDRAAPWLATAGAGDVLAGMIAGLLARSMPPRTAAEAAAWLHVEAARAFGPGLIAEDLPEMLPRVFRDLGLQAATVSGSAEASSRPSA